MSHAIRATRRYVFNLHEELTTIQVAGGYPPDSDVAKAWIVEHLRAYHYLDVGELHQLTHRNDINQVAERIGERYSKWLHHALYRLFVDVAHRALEAAFVRVSFKNDHLSLLLYDYLPD